MEITDALTLYTGLFWIFYTPSKTLCSCTYYIAYYIFLFIKYLYILYTSIEYYESIYTIRVRLLFRQECCALVVDRNASFLLFSLFIYNISSLYTHILLCHPTLNDFNSSTSSMLLSMEAETSSSIKSIERGAWNIELDE